jgi:glycosyltransferase involved in cell wall biosynthesis
MVSIANSPEKRADMGAQGRRKVQREFDWDVKGGRMLVLYRAVLAKGR